MPLRRALVLILCITLVIPAILMGGLALRYAMSNHRQLETAVSHERMEQVRVAYDQHLRQFKALAFDWGQWDDAVAFARNPDMQSMRSWLTEYESYSPYGLSHVVFATRDLRIIFAGMTDLQKGTFHEITKNSKESISSILDMVIPGKKFGEERQGIIPLDHKVYSFVSAPILDINKGSEGLGFILLMREINSNFWRQLGIPPSVNVASTLVTESESLHIDASDDSQLVNQIEIPALIKGGKLRVTVSSDRGLFLKVAQVRNYFIVGICLVALLSIAVTWLLIDRKLTKPVEELQREATAIRTSGDFSLRLSCEANNEIGDVATSVNAMLSRLESVHAEVVTARQEAEKANKAKTSFISKVSHELRTPIFSIQGNLRMLRKSPLDEKGTEQVRRIGDAADGLLMVVNSILDFAELSSTRLHFRASEFEVGEVLHEVALAQMPMLRDKPQLAVTAKISNALPQYMKLDERRFGQVVQHLLSNGIKFTERGNVEVLVSPAEKGIVIAVRDTGIGMSPEQLEQTLGAFEQFEDTSNRKFDGLGLGLTLCRKIIDAFGGTLSFESSVGRGTTAKAFIPVEYENNPAASGERTVFSHGQETTERGGITPATTPLRILVAEDEIANQIILKEMLEELGHQVVCVDNGLQLVSLLEESLGADGSSERVSSFDLVIADLDMPGCSGTEAIRRFRSSESGRTISNPSRTPVLVVTANGSSAAAQEAKDAGSDGVVLKPVLPEQLAQAISVARASSGRAAV